MYQTIRVKKTTICCGCQHAKCMLFLLVSPHGIRPRRRHPSVSIIKRTWQIVRWRIECVCNAGDNCIVSRSRQTTTTHAKQLYSAQCYSRAYNRRRACEIVAKRIFSLCRVLICRKGISTHALCLQTKSALTDR